MNVKYSVCMVLMCAVIAACCVRQGLCQAPEKQVIRLKGSNAMANLTDKIASDFRTANPNITVLVTGGGTDAGFEALFEKGAELVMASRKITAKEVQGAAVHGVAPVEVEVGADAIAIITSPENSLTELTLEQLGKIFTGEVANWSEVGGKNQPIILLTSEQITGTALFLRSQLMQDAQFSADARQKKHYSEMMKEISARKGLCIGYAGLPDAERGVRQKMVKIMALRKDPLDPAIFPSRETIRNRSYPLVRPFFLYMDGNTANQAVKKFAEFLKAKGGNLY